MVDEVNVWGQEGSVEVGEVTFGAVAAGALDEAIITHSLSAGSSIDISLMSKGSEALGRALVSAVALNNLGDFVHQGASGVTQAVVAISPSTSNQITIAARNGYSVAQDLTIKYRIMSRL